MPAEPLRDAARRRHLTAVDRAERALRDLDREGASINFQAVAQRAGVSRQWLYTQPVIRAEVERLRHDQPAAAGAVPARQRASDASLRQRADSLRADNQRLRYENAALKDELAIAYGRQRAAG